MQPDLSSSCRAGLSSSPGARRVASHMPSASGGGSALKHHITLRFGSAPALLHTGSSGGGGSTVMCNASSAATAVCSGLQQRLAHGLQQLQHPAASSLVASCSGGVAGSLQPHLAAPRAAAVTAAGSAGRSRRSHCPASLALLAPAATSSTALHSAAAGFNFSHALAVALGYAVLAGSLFRSVPQIAKVLKHNSTEGLSLTSYVVELCCYSVVIAYNISQGYGFNTFGEVCACWAQDVILIALIFRFNRTPVWAVAGTSLLIALGCCWLLSPACPSDVLSALQASTIAIMALGSRLPQIILNIRRGNAGVMSVATCLLNVAGNAARVFTTIVLTGDLLILGGVLTQGCLNVILLSQSLATAKARRAEPAAEPSNSAAMQAKQQQLQPDAPIIIGPSPADGAGGFIMQPAAS